VIILRVALVYTGSMEKEFAPTRLDIKALALAAGSLSGRDSLLKYERLVLDHQGIQPDSSLNWAITGELRTGRDGKPEPWLHLSLDTHFDLTCQRCLGPVSIPFSAERSFRFVATEAEAEAQDDDSEEDVLVISREFNLAELIEDELVMGQPLIPRHEVCPTPVKLEAADADFDAAGASKPNPFAALASLATIKTSKTK
jgi:uncharacterized protein